MSRSRFSLFVVLFLSRALSPASSLSYPQEHNLPSVLRGTVIEDFDDGEVELGSYPEQDLDPDSWLLDAEVTYDGSPYSLKLFGNTWKTEEIEPVALDFGDVWEVAAYTQGSPEIHGFGIMDDSHVLFYSFAGTQQLDIEEWVTVYQGAFEQDQWNVFPLPVTDDWLAFFGYLPEITGLVFVSDNDGAAPGIAYFDLIVDITDDLPAAPEVEIGLSMGKIHTSPQGMRHVDVQFFGIIHDPDSESHEFYWDFGDDSTSTEQNPMHTYLVLDDHAYTVLLEVVDDTDLWGRATCMVDVDPGPTSFPVTMNLVGDIMLARGYEQSGGIIPTQGVEAIFEPTLAILGQAADVTVANLECPLTDCTEHHPTKPIYFKSSPENVAGLVYAGIDVVTIANNHIIDYLLPGLQQTQAVLAENDVVYAGAGANSYEAYLPAFFSKSGVNLAFLFSSDRTGQYNNDQPYLNAGYNKPGFANMTEYAIARQIDVVRDYADLIIVGTHSGTEYAPIPREEYDETELQDPYGDEEYFASLLVPADRDRAIRQAAIDSGADLVVNHHPHVIQGFELYNGKVIAHSLGNFTFDLRYPETFPTMVLNTKIDEAGFSEFSITPVYLDDWIPVPATGELGQHLLDYLARRSKELDTYLFVDRYHITAGLILDTLSVETQERTFAASCAVIEENGVWVAEPIPLARRGHISSVDAVSPPGQDWSYRLGREIIWFGNFENEGCTLWNVNSDHEWYDESTSYEGDRSLCHRRQADSGINVVTNFERRVKRYEDSDFSLHGCMKTQNGAEVTIQIRYYETRYGSTILDTEDMGMQIWGDSDWAFYSKELTVPEQTNYFDIRLFSNCPEQGEALSWFDNVGLIQWTEWRSFGGKTEVAVPNDYYWLQLMSNSVAESVSVSYTETEFGFMYLPQIVLDPCSLAIAVPVNGSTSAPIMISNAGDGSLRFALSEAADWLQCAPRSGCLGPGSAQEITAHVNALGLEEGHYGERIIVRSSDPYAGTMEIPVDLYVSSQTSVTDLCITPLDDSMRLSWSPIPFAESYHIYRSEYPYGPWELIVTQEGTEYIDEHVSTTHDQSYYQVTAELPTLGGIPGNHEKMIRIRRSRPKPATR